jgi:3-oxoacyl-[acyl-carrier-protein] synthase II
MKEAMNDADIGHREVDYINAYGNATLSYDRAETKSIKTVFDEHAYKIPVSSIKSMIGHTIGASGAIEAASCFLALENNIVPPTINYKNPDPECDLDYVPNRARKSRLNNIMINSLGIGNENASLIIGRPVDRRSIN